MNSQKRMKTLAQSSFGVSGGGEHSRQDARTQRGIDAKPKNNIESCGSDILNRQNALASSHLKAKTAFTLAEMMVVMLIVSIALAAMAPVMTTKMKSDRAREAAGSIWQYAANNSDIYYSTDGAQSVMVGQREVGDDDPASLLVLNTDNNDRNHILFKIRDNVIAFLKLRYFAAEDEFSNYGISVAIGSDVDANAKNTIAIGNKPVSSALGAIAIANQVSSYNVDTVHPAINVTPSASGEKSIAIGSDVEASGNSAISIGEYSKVSVNNSIAIGSVMKHKFGGKFVAYGPSVESASSIAIGQGAQVKSDSAGSIVIGRAARPNSNTYLYARIDTNSPDSIAIGTGAEVKQNSAKSIVLGYSAKVKMDTANSIAIGNEATTKGENTIAIGKYASASGSNNIAIGTSACKYVTGSNKVCIGANSGPAGSNSFATDEEERIFIGSSSKFNGATSVLEIHNVSDNFEINGGGANYKLNASGVVINGSLIVKGPLIAAGVSRGAVWSDPDTPGYYSTFEEHPGSGDYPDLVGSVISSGNNWKNHPIFSSDRRLKYVGKENKDGLSKLRQIKVFNYTFKKDPSKEPRVGVIAQDLQKIFPNAVKKGSDGFLTIRMEDMFYALVNAVKELDVKVTGILNQVQNDRVQIQKDKNEIQALKKENKILKEQNKMLDARLKAIEAKLK